MVKVEELPFPLLPLTFPFPPPYVGPYLYLYTAVLLCELCLEGVRLKTAVLFSPHRMSWRRQAHHDKSTLIRCTEPFSSLTVIGRDGTPQLRGEAAHVAHLQYVKVSISTASIILKLVAARKGVECHFGPEYLGK